jgi:hypothetical protein
MYIVRQEYLPNPTDVPTVEYQVKQQEGDIQEDTSSSHGLQYTTTKTSCASRKGYQKPLVLLEKGQAFEQVRHTSTHTVKAENHDSRPVTLWVNAVLF